MGSRKILTIVLILLAHPIAARAGWKPALVKRLSKLEKRYGSNLGVYVKELATGDEAALHADEPWYLASGVKVPIALEVLSQIDEGRHTLDTLVRLEDADFIDGAGETNFKPVGSKLSVRFLLEQMLVHSDNTASDLLIKLVGLEKVNARVNTLVPGQFAPITSLSDVRRRTYGKFHPSAAALKNADYMRLKALKGEGDRVSELARMLGVPPSSLVYKRVDDAFNAYYETKVNSASLRAYARLLEKIDSGTALSPNQSAYLKTVLSRVKTGRSRIVAGLPRSVVFAHKTGTQHARICDFGIAWDRNSPNARRFVIAACTRGIRSLTGAEAVLREVGQAIADSGALGSCNADCS